MPAMIDVRAEALSGWANTVRVLTWSWLLLGAAASLTTIILGLQHASAPAVLAGVGSLFVTGLVTSLLLMFASWALLAATTARAG